jgi:hypothetical protein
VFTARLPLHLELQEEIKEGRYESTLPSNYKANDSINSIFEGHLFEGHLAKRNPACTKK